MKKNKLGNTGIEVTQLCFGSLTMSPMQRGLSVEKGAGVILHALKAGVTFVDTAQMYGSYPQVGTALKKWTGSRPCISSKSAMKDRQGMENAIKECLTTIGVDYIDVFLLHAVRDEDDYSARAEALNVLKEAKKSGKIKAIGASSHSAKTIKFLSNQPDIDVLHPMINRDGIGILDASLDYMIDTLKNAKKNGKGIYAMKPLGGGHLRSDAVKALRWLFESEIVDSVAVGMSCNEEVDMNVSIANGETINEDFAKNVAGRSRKLFINTGICINCNTCLNTCQQSALTKGDKYPQINHDKCILCGYCAPVCPKFAIRIV